mmetsp:Transcript_22260/g.65621  ORF Transcript_22260/g.65621 Transcript_22260/m.65621 type:complete len:206 (+) Transcript_22260:448-1065(+)
MEDEHRGGRRSGGRRVRPRLARCGAGAPPEGGHLFVGPVGALSTRTPHGLRWPARGAPAPDARAGAHVPRWTARGPERRSGGARVAGWRAAARVAAHVGLHGGHALPRHQLPRRDPGLPRGPRARRALSAAAPVVGLHQHGPHHALLPPRLRRAAQGLGPRAPGRDLGADAAPRRAPRVRHPAVVPRVGQQAPSRRGGLRRHAAA